MKRATTILLFLCLVSASVRLRAQTTGTRELNTAIQTEQEKRYDDALRQYERIFNSTDAALEVKLEAKVRAGRIYMDEKNDLAKAVPLFEEGTRGLGFKHIVALATVYSGKALLAKAASKADLDAALSEFDTVAKTYADSPSVVEALIRGGRVLEVQHKYERAIINYQTVVFGFPESDLAPIAFSRLGYTLARQGSIENALGAYENLQLRYRGKDEAADARRAATLLYRLFQLKPPSTPFSSKVFAGKSDSFKLDDPSKLVYLTSGELEVVDKEREYTLSTTGQARAASGKLPDCVDNRGTGIQIVQKTLATANAKPLLPYIKKPDKNEPFNEIITCGVSSYGDLIISTKGPEGIYRVDPKTGESTPFVPNQKSVRKIAIDSESNFYMLDANGTNLAVMDSRGKGVTGVTGQMVGIKEFADFTLDAFDNLYLLDKQGKFIVVGRVEPGQELRLSTIHKQEVLEASKPVNNLRAIAVSPSGTVYVAGKETVFAFQ